MAIDDKIKDEKLQYNINREAAKISALFFGKVDINMNILLVKKHCLLSLLILLSVKRLKNK